MDKKTQIIAVAGKGGVGKTSLAGVIVKLLANILRPYIGVNITALLAYYEFLENLLWRNAVSNTHTW